MKITAEHAHLIYAHYRRTFNRLLNTSPSLSEFKMRERIYEFWFRRFMAIDAASIVDAGLA